MPNTTISVAERDEGQDLDRRHVGQVVAEPVEEVGHLAEHDPPVHVQQVAGGQDHHERRDRGGVPGSTTNVPTSTRNSPTKPDSPGSPAEAKTKNPKTAAQTGVRAASPPILAIVRSWVRS